MKVIETTLITKAHFSDDGAKRYLLEKTWDESKPKLTVIMMAPSIAEGIALDSTTLLCLNNASRLGYGSVAIVNLFATLNDFDLKHAEDEDAENMRVILNTAQEADAVVHAPGIGKTKMRAFQQRQKQALTALAPVEDKLFCLTDSDGTSRFQHPLSPSVRTWHLSPMKIEELIKNPSNQDVKEKHQGESEDNAKKSKGKKSIK